MRTNVAGNITDSAAEFAGLIERLRSHQSGSKSPSWSIIASLLQSDDDEHIMLAYNSLRRRSRELQEFILGLDDEYLDAELQKISFEAIGQLGSAFYPQNFNAQ